MGHHLPVRPRLHASKLSDHRNLSSSSNRPHERKHNHLSRPLHLPPPRLQRLNLSQLQRVGRRKDLRRSPRWDITARRWMIRSVLLCDRGLVLARRCSPSLTPIGWTIRITCNLTRLYNRRNQQVYNARFMAGTSSRLISFVSMEHYM